MHPPVAAGQGSQQHHGGGGGGGGEYPYIVPDTVPLIGPGGESFSSVGQFEVFSSKLAATEVTTSLSGIDFSSLPDEFDENSRKETEVLNTNRVKLTEYVHDCTVLHPYMKEKRVFNVADCQVIQHQVTGAQRMDTFVDIVLTKGPKAIGVFHESLKKPYPYVFDILARLFTAAGLQLSENRQIIEDSFEDGGTVGPPDFSQSTASESSSSSQFVRGKTGTIRRTIRKHIDELTERCEVVKNQRDELQKVLLQRERDINALMSHRDRVIQQKYEDMLSLLANWREIVTHQSDGNIQKMQELLSEHEGIRQDYDMLEGDYMLVVSELSAARDRIAKLLTHLQKMETEYALAQDEKDALSDKLLVQQGEIQRVRRRFERMGKHDGRVSPERDVLAPKHKCDCKALEEKLKEYEDKMNVCHIERKDALDERDNMKLKLYEEKLKLHEEKQKRKKAKQEAGPKYTDSPLSLVFQEDIPAKHTPIIEETVVMPANDSGIKIGLAIVVRELTESGNAFQHGMRIGDEIYEVNRIKLDSDREPLQFAQRMLQSASQMVTLSIKRQTTPSLSSSSSSSLLLPQTRNHTALLASQSVTPGATSQDIASLYSLFPRPRPRNIRPQFSNPSCSTSNSGRSHEDVSENSDDENYVFSEPEYTTLESDSCQDLITSPLRQSNAHHSKQKLSGKSILATMQSDPGDLPFVIRGSGSQKSNGTMMGHVFPGPCDPATSNAEFDCRRDNSGYNSVSPDPPPGRHHLSPMKQRPRRAIRKGKGKSIRRKRRPESENVTRLSRSVDDIDLMWTKFDVQSDELHREDGSRRVLLSSGQLGAGLSILGGRGNGLYIKSERKSERSLRTGDQILLMCGTSALKMTYSEAMELLNKYHKTGKQCLLQVKYDKEGYQKLDAFSRDNFYVKAKKAYKSRARQELSFEEGDIFHVIDTKPTGHTDLTNMWQVEKLNCRGHIISTGCIPIALEQDDYVGLSSSGYQSLPNFIGIKPTPASKKLNSNFTLHHPISKQPVSASDAFKLYRPVIKIVVTEPRPVVLMGVFDAELSEYLVERGSKGALKFAFPSREPMEKMQGVEDTNIIESVSVADGIMQSTIDDIMEVTRSGYHCVLRLTTSCLAKPKVGALRPIVVTLSPHSKTVRVKTSGGRLPACFSKEVIPQDSISAIKDKVRHTAKVMASSSKCAAAMYGEIDVPSSVNLEDLLINIQEKVEEKQKAVFWEMDP